MAQQLFANNAKATVSGSLAQAGTTLTLASGTGSLFPNPTAGDYFIGSLFEKDVNGAAGRIENVKVIGRTNDTITLGTRDFETMTGQAGGYAYPSVDGSTVYFALRYSAHAAGNTLNKDDNLAGLASTATARTNLGLGNIDNTRDADKPVSAAQAAADTAVKNSSAPLAHVGTGGYEHANAVPSGAAGFMTGEDKTKLDGLSGTSAAAWTIKTATYTAAAKDAVQANTTAGAFTITLPPSPAANDTVRIADYAGTFASNNLTIGRNSLKIMGLNEDMTISINNVSLTLTYIDATQGWRIV